MNLQTTPVATVIDGSRAGQQAKRRQREVVGLDFPLAGDITVRLPYPTWRYSPAHPIEPGPSGTPGSVKVERRFGYPRVIEGLIAKFKDSLASDDSAECFAAGVVLAWALLQLAPTDPQIAERLKHPTLLFEMGELDAVVFLTRLFRLVNGLADLDLDDSGAYVLPVATMELDPALAESPDGNEPLP